MCLSDNPKLSVKQPKPAKSPLPTPPTPVSQGLRYRYFSNPPSTVTLRLGDFSAQIPADCRLAAFDELRVVELPCDEILRGPVPAIALSRISALVPDCIGAAADRDPVLRLPASRLAAGYRFIQTQELIEEPVAAAVIVEDFPPPAEFGAVDFSAVPDSARVPEAEPEPAASSPDPGSASSAESAADSPEKFSAPAPGKDVGDPSPVPAPETAPSVPAPRIEASPAEAIAPEPLPPVPPVPPPASATAVSALSDAPPVDPPPPAPKLPQSRRIFSILPIFRRKEAAAPPPPPATDPKPPEPRPRVEIPKPKLPHSPITGASFPAGKSGPLPPVAPPDPVVEPDPAPAVPPVDTAPAALPIPPQACDGAVLPQVADVAKVTEVAEAPMADPAVEKPVPDPAAESPAVWVETEHLPQSDRRVPEEIPDQDGLQAVFMTEEFLSLDRVITLCGGLPGIKSCVLAHGSAVLAAHCVPDTIDIVSLSANALEMLRGLRESSAKMGVGAIPAVTLHSDKGPITFFHKDDLCLLVLHKDRGFVPGVREKLQQVVEELGKANLPLLVSPSKSSLEG